MSVTRTLAIVDCGSGNLRSVEKAFERAAHDAGQTLRVIVTQDPDVVSRADRLVLPGVGAFSDCRAGLIGIEGMLEALEEAIGWKGRPLLGICVGMQLMATRGLEHGRHEGLDWIKGEVVPITPASRKTTRPFKVPHLGWNLLTVRQTSHPVLRALPQGAEGPHVYFVHSYRFEARDTASVLATTDYGGQITAVIGRDNLIGTQFHPEKSQGVGLALLKNFLMWSP